MTALETSGADFLTLGMGAFTMRRMNTDTLESLKEVALSAFAEAKSIEALRVEEVKFLGRKSEFNQLLKSLASLSSEERREVGGQANEVKREILDAVEAARIRLESAGFDAEKEWVDVTDPGETLPGGHLHILTRVEREICDIFRSLGFAIADGPEVETEFYNFDALNIPADHPARDMQDTFWLKTTNNEQGTMNRGQRSEKRKGDRLALRSQTSAAQVRYMETHTPPFRVIVPGRCFRAEATDSTHEHTFHQFEMLAVDESASVGNLKYMAELFFSRFFGKIVHVRLRPSYFPFVEPGFEFDISCLACGGTGCSSCRGAGWLELGGAGMVNQNVFVSAGYERDRYHGYAWGFGLERLAMMQYKIPDIRLFQSGDLRFLNQF